MDKGTAWLDTGTTNSLMEASQFVHVLEKRQGLKVACLEEIAYRNNWISKNALYERAEELTKTEYGQYLRSISKDYS